MHLFHLVRHLRGHRDRGGEYVPLVRRAGLCYGCGFCVWREALP